MENNINPNVQPPINSAPVPTSAPAQVSRKGGFWKGFAVGVVVMVVLGFSIPFAISMLVVKPSLDAARTKANVAAVRSNIAQLRAQGELYYDLNRSYTGVCQSTAFISTLDTVFRLAYKGDTLCLDRGSKYVVAATIQDVDGIKTVCADSAGTMVTNPGSISETRSLAQTSCI